MNAKRSTGQGSSHESSKNQGKASILDPEQSASAGCVPLQLLIAQIDEDPLQPRTSDNPGFSQASLQELASTIIQRGVKSPISVRENPGSPGRYLVNHGARRLRASRLAGKDTIAAFVDNDYSELDQVVENLQRNELTAREIADFIGRELSRGLRRAEIAKAIGKSAAFITQHANLLDLPEPIGTTFNTGRCKDVTVINELLTAFKKHPEAVTSWLSDPTQDVTRSAVKLLREYLDDKQDAYTRQQGLSYDSSGQGQIQEDELTNQLQDDLLEEDAASYGDTRAVTTGERRRSASQPVIQVLHKGRKAHLLIQRKPPSEGWGWVRFEDDGRVTKAELSELKLVALILG